MIVYLDHLRFKISYQLAKILAKTKITPNQVTILRFIIAAPLSWYFFSRGAYLFNVIGLIFYVSLAVIDWADGNLARLTGRVSALGKWLDIVFDRILMLVVLGGIFYAKMYATSDWAWSKLAVLFYSVFFFLTTIQYNFDQIFNLGFDLYPEVAKRLYELNEHPKLPDKLLINFLDVHRNSISKFCFCISYPLFVGIITNQLFITFTFITFMFGLRAIGFLFSMYSVLKKDNVNDSTLTKVLREYMSKK